MATTEPQDPPSLSRRERQVLLALEVEGDVSLGDIAAVLEVSRTRVWQLCRSLKAKGLATIDEPGSPWGWRLTQKGDRAARACAESSGDKPGETNP